MESYQVRLSAGRVNEAASLFSWLRRQGAAVSYENVPETMGTSEVVVGVVASDAALRALVLIAQEWIRAHRTKISVRVEGRGSFEVEGTTDIDELVALLHESRPSSSGGAAPSDRAPVLEKPAAHQGSADVE